MSDHRITLKLNIHHDVRNQDKSVAAVEDGLQRYLNHPDTEVVDVDMKIGERLEDVGGHVDETVYGLRIAVGHRASGVFVELVDKRWSHDNLTTMVRRVERELEAQQYADNVSCQDWHIEATEPGKRV